MTEECLKLWCIYGSSEDKKETYFYKNWYIVRGSTIANLSYSEPNEDLFQMQDVDCVTFQEQMFNVEKFKQDIDEVIKDREGNE